MNNPIEEKRRLVQERISKSFDSGINIAEEMSLEKAWNVGDEKQYQGVTYYVHAFNAKGQPLWRKKKDGGGSDKKAGASTTAAGSKVDIAKIPNEEFKRITKMLEKKNPDHRNAERYLEEEEMSDKELANFHAVAEHYKNSDSINKLTQEYCKKWAELAKQEMQYRKKENSSEKQSASKEKEQQSTSTADIEIDQEVYDKMYKTATSKEETEKHLKESLNKIERNIKEVKDAISESSTKTVIDQMKKMLTSSVSKKKAIEDALKLYDKDKKQEVSKNEDSNYRSVKELVDKQQHKNNKSNKTADKQSGETNSGNFKGMKLTEILDSLDDWGDDEWNNQSLNDKLSAAISSAIKSEKIDEKKFNEIAKKYQGLDLVYTDYADLDDETKVKRATSDFAKILRPLDDWDDDDWNDEKKNIKLENDIKTVIRKNKLSEKQFNTIAKKHTGLDLVYTDFIPQNSSEYKKFN